jgi:hypothetical protein
MWRRRGGALPDKGRRVGKVPVTDGMQNVRQEGNPSSRPRSERACAEISPGWHCGTSRYLKAPKIGRNPSSRVRGEGLTLSVTAPSAFRDRPGNRRGKPKGANGGPASQVAIRLNPAGARRWRPAGRRKRDTNYVLRGNVPATLLLLAGNRAGWTATPAQSTRDRQKQPERLGSKVRRLGRTRRPLASAY